MRVLQEYNASSFKMLKPEENPVPPFRKYTYCEACRVKAGFLLFQYVTSEVLLLEKSDFRSGILPPELEFSQLEPSCAEYLLSHHFFVSAAHEDYRDVERIRDILKLRDQVNFNGFTSFTILTTTDCNARCFYCYENGMRKIIMDEKTAGDVADFILKNLEQAGEKSVRLGWFGGEPLCNGKAIDIICKRLSDAGIEYISSIYSNALLFTEEIVEKAVRLWKLTHIQITLDGTRDIYNETKAYIGDAENAYETVLFNMGKLLEAGVRVHVRLNIGEHNVEDLSVLADELAERFTKEKPYVYGHLLFQYYQPENLAKKPALEEKFQQLKDKLRRLGLFGQTANPDQFEKENVCGGVRSDYCMADNPSSVVILPDGRLHSCEHLDEETVWGSIYQDRNKLDRCQKTESGMVSPIEYWSEYLKSDNCRACEVYPFCIRLTRCPGFGTVCDTDSKERIQRRIDEIKRHFINEVEQ